MSPNEVYEKIKQDSVLAIKQKRQDRRVMVYVGSATCENAAGSTEVYKALMKIKQEKNLDYVYVGQTGCSGRCDKEPIVQVLVDGMIPVKYFDMNPDKMASVIDQHIINKNIIKEWTL